MEDCTSEHTITHRLYTQKDPDDIEIVELDQRTGIHVRNGVSLAGKEWRSIKSLGDRSEEPMRTYTVLSQGICGNTTWKKFSYEQFELDHPVRGPMDDMEKDGVVTLSVTSVVRALGFGYKSTQGDNSYVQRALKWGKERESDGLRLFALAKGCGKPHAPDGFLNLCADIRYFEYLSDPDQVAVVVTYDPGHSQKSPVRRQLRVPGNIDYRSCSLTEPAAIVEMKCPFGSNNSKNYPRGYKNPDDGWCLDDWGRVVDMVFLTYDPVKYNQASYVTKGKSMFRHILQLQLYLHFSCERSGYLCYSFFDVVKKRQLLVCLYVVYDFDLIRAVGLPETLANLVSARRVTEDLVFGKGFNTAEPTLYFNTATKKFMVSHRYLDLSVDAFECIQLKQWYLFDGSMGSPSTSLLFTYMDLQDYTSEDEDVRLFIENIKEVSDLDDADE